MQSQDSTITQAQPHKTPLGDEESYTLLQAKSSRMGRASARSGRGFLIGTLTTFCLGLAGMAGLCWYVNPWGNYGTTGFHTLGDARRAKTEYIDSLPAESLPEAIILGSSNTMRYRPKKIREGLGLTAFNYAVFWGKAEDHLCILRHLIDDLKHHPRLIILGVDTWTFAPPGDEHPIFPGLRRRLLNTPQLIRHLPEISPLKIQWARFADLFSGQQIRLSLRLLWGGKVFRTTRMSLKHTDRMTIEGLRLYYGGMLADHKNIFTEAEAGQYPITDLLKDLIKRGNSKQIDFLTRQYDFDQFWPVRIEYMRKLLTLCRQQDIKIAFAINPVHPLFYDRLVERTPHLKNLERLRRLLKQFEQEYDVVAGFIDASRIDNFGGDPDGFYDPMHPATRNCDLILDRVIQLIKAS